VKPGDIPIWDNHFHLDPAGAYLAAARRFKEAGGTHLMLVNKPYAHIEPGRWEKQFDCTLKSAEDVRRELSLQVFVALGPYPIELKWLAEAKGRDEAVKEMRRGLGIASTLVREGRAHAIGEVGRFHFDVEPWLQEESNAIIDLVFETVRDLGCGVILHTESTTPEVCADLASRARRANLTLDRVVKHFCPALVLERENHGLVPSMIASRRNVREALAKSADARFMLETDHIDDLSRKDSVLPPDGVPRRTFAMLRGREMSEAQARRTHEELPRAVYRIDV
jgi:TatD-related deoxyribonuclease